MFSLNRVPLIPIQPLTNMNGILAMEIKHRGKKLEIEHTFAGPGDYIVQ